jgi:hypothetical protein
VAVTRGSQKAFGRLRHGDQRAGDGGQLLSQVRFPKGLDLDKFPEGLDIEAITPFTSMLIDSEWPRIQWLAAHLAERKQLTYAEVRRWLRLREWMGHEARRYLDAEALAACLTR